MLSKENRIDGFTKAEFDVGLSEDIIEKDFWVCWSLKELFNLEEFKNNLTFKGGTSISKICKVIHRFSEDIDVSIERSYLGFKDDKDPANVGSKQAKKFVKDELLNKLNEVFKSKLGTDEWKLEIDEEDRDGQTILFTYPKLTTKASTYIKPVVKIELGARSDHWPVSMQKSSPYLTEILQSPLNCRISPISVS